MIHEHDTRLQRNFLSAAFELGSLHRDRLATMPREWWTDFGARAARDAILADPTLDLMGYLHQLVASGAMANHQDALMAFPAGMLDLPSSVDYSIEQIRQSYVRHQVENFTDCVRMASAAGMSAEDRLAILESNLARIRNTSKPGVSHYDHIKFAAIQANQDILDAQDALKTENRSRAIPTQVGTLDDFLFGGGFRAGQHILIGARPGIGKSSLMANLALNQARAGYRIGIVSLEMTAQHLAEIIAQIEAGQGFQKFHREPMTEWESTLLSTSIHKICDLPIWVDDASQKTVEQVVSRFHQMVNVECCDVVYVDYAQKIAFSGKEDSVRELNHISAQLTAAAKELGVPVVSLAQLNRDATNAEPKLEHIKGSGQFEQDAHIALLIHRPHKDDDGPDEKIQIHIAKQRRGIAHAHVTATFHRATQRIY